VTRVTVDTNVLDQNKVARIHKAVEGLEVELAFTTVTERERPGSGLEFGVANPVPETLVWDESLWDEAVWGNQVYETLTVGESRVGSAALGGSDSPSRFEEILAIIADGSFPKRGERGALTVGERNQLRDAMILEAHARDGRDVLVTDDLKGFIGPAGQKRQRLEALCSTRIMAVDEFCAEIGNIARGTKPG